MVDAHVVKLKAKVPEIATCTITYVGAKGRHMFFDVTSAKLGDLQKIEMFCDERNVPAEVRPNVNLPLRTGNVFVTRMLKVDKRLLGY